MGKGMNGGGEGGRVGEVHALQLLQSGLHGDGGDGDVGDLVHVALAQHLQAHRFIVIKKARQLQAGTADIVHRDLDFIVIL